MEEKINILDTFGIKIDSDFRSIVHKNSFFHEGVHLWLFNEKNQLLLQKRSKSVSNYKNMWHISLTGHMKENEKSSTALKREVMEELGIDISNIVVMPLIRIYAPARIEELDNVLDKMYLNVYIGKTDKKIGEFSKSKSVQKLKFIDFKKFESEISINHQTKKYIQQHHIYYYQQIIDLIKERKLVS